MPGELAMTRNNTPSALILLCTLTLTGLRPVFAAPLNFYFDTAIPTIPAGTPAVAPSAPQQPPQGVYGTDVTAEYQTALAAADTVLTEELVKELKEYKVLFVPGLFSNVDKTKLPLVGIFCSSKTKPRYEEHMALLKSLGVDFERLELQTESSIQVNAVGITAAIRASKKPVIIIGSSKAGLDVLEALLTDKALVNKVRGVLMLQVPFMGTPVADKVVSNTKVGRFLNRILTKLGGSLDSLLNLTTAEREIYMRQNSAAIEQLAATTPFISVATWMDPAPKGTRDTGLKMLRNFMLKRGLVNDGLVPLDSAVMPGAAYIKIPGADHGATAQPTKLSFDRVKFTKAALAMLLS
ncbi:MAG: hypothetical protein A2285_08685, partial [Elusimicrobia bacterium RIFOXYA12_FULL_57_11]